MSRWRDGSVGREGRIDAGRRAKAARGRVEWERAAALEGIEEEDHVVPDGDQLRPAPAPATVGELLGGLVDRRGWGERLRGAQLERLWSQVVGEDLATRCRPGRLAGGTLVVVVASPQWATQLRYLGPTLAARASQVAGTPVDQVRIVVGPLEDGDA